MKRFLVTILAILYMAGAMGATVHIHYCMDKLRSASLLDKDEDKCGKCGMSKQVQKKKNCCRDEHKTFKSAVHHAAKASIDIAHQQFVLVHPAVYSYYIWPVQSVCINKLAQTHAPPAVWRTCPIYVQVCNFRI